MAKKSFKAKNVPYRRKREGKTNYKTRLSLLKSGKNRLVVRFSSTSVYAQIIKYSQKGDEVLVSSSSQALKKIGWHYGPNMTTAYLVGMHIAKLAKEKKVKDAIFDIGLKRGSKIYAVLKGAVEGGLDIPHEPEVLPAEDRISGKHIVEYAKQLKGDKERFEKQFSGYTKNKVNPENIEKDFEQLKAKL